MEESQERRCLPGRRQPGSHLKEEGRGGEEAQPGTAQARTDT